ncbi:P-loop NTPase fold protein [Sulfurimonas sp. NWX79]|uniref:KAP family P-loop NTPase fold protein n=1 Tax=Sulfurimonas sp. NWX79 TaxID=2925412 RepID=UPI003204948B
MPNFEDTEPLLSANTREYVGDTVFSNDKLDRRRLAEQLTGYLERLSDGSVLAIDAPWGEGKTWFGKNWNKHLQDLGHKTIYIDAFEQDYIEDPFVLLSSEILELIEEDSLQDNLKKNSIAVAKALLPTIGKIAINAGGKFLLGTTNISDEIREVAKTGTSHFAELASSLIEDNLESYSQDKVAMKEFKKNLADFANIQDKPIVIFIDELDRCKPDFAVNVIERVKHFFDVPNVIFVLLLNREQLEKAVKGVYGLETDASAYLGKFVNFFFTLPKPIIDGLNSEHKLNAFIHLTMQKYKFKRQGDEHDAFINHLKIWVKYFNMSLRDIEKAVALYAFANNSNVMLVYLISLKLMKPRLYKKIVLDDIKAHQEAKEILEKFLHNDENSSYLKLYIQWHEAYINKWTNLGERFKEVLQSFHRYSYNPDLLLSELAKTIDLSIE